MGLSPAIFPCVKLIQKNVSSVELKHSTSQGEMLFLQECGRGNLPQHRGSKNHLRAGQN